MTPIFDSHLFCQTRNFIKPETISKSAEFELRTFYISAAWLTIIPVQLHIFDNNKITIISSLCRLNRLMALSIRVMNENSNKNVTRYKSEIFLLAIKYKEINNRKCGDSLIHFCLSNIFIIVFCSFFNLIYFMALLFRISYYTYFYSLRLFVNENNIPNLIYSTISEKKKKRKNKNTSLHSFIWIILIVQILFRWKYY